MLRAYATVGSLVVGPAIVAPMLAISPPLQSDAALSGKRSTYAVEMNMSGPAMAGRRIFADNCAECHGSQGEGTPAGPALRGAGFSGQQSRAFHEAVTGETVPAHAEVSRRSVGFNEIERMAKFLRELQNVDRL